MRRQWIHGMTMGKHRFRREGRSLETYYFVDDRSGGRRPASDLEVALWKKSVGSIPFGPDDCVTSRGAPPKRSTPNG